jgi:hypothetical protein
MVSRLCMHLVGAGDPYLWMPQAIRTRSAESCHSPQRGLFGLTNHRQNGLTKFTGSAAASRNSQLRLRLNRFTPNSQIRMNSMSAPVHPSASMMGFRFHAGPAV